ncbi:hypothetical protein [Niveibacterium sp. COAC-50]|uniref:hypothetical protein n=1 Tax=Niveibacterium sp. COAC-50 TaxID=2729384 RepID=UPI001554BF45|nr:hypothetical protein [Niveibacterium sp. COAC-50]
MFSKPLLAAARPAHPSPLPTCASTPSYTADDADVALEALLRWARASGRPFDAVLPLVTGRFAPPEIVTFMDRCRPGAASLRELYEAL